MPRYWLCYHLIPCNKFQTTSAGIAAGRPATERLWSAWQVTRDAAQQPAASAIRSKPILKCEQAQPGWSTREPCLKTATFNVQVSFYFARLLSKSKNIYLARHQDQRLRRPWARFRLIKVELAWTWLTSQTSDWLITYLTLSGERIDRLKQAPAAKKHFQPLMKKSRKKNSWRKKKKNLGDFLHVRFFPQVSSLPALNMQTGSPNAVRQSL